MLVYIAFRFEWIYGLGAVIAVFHDTIITIGMFSLFDKEIDLTVIAALLTLVGYSMNEHDCDLRPHPRESTLRWNAPRTSGRRDQSERQSDVEPDGETSGLTFLTVLALFLFGGPVLHNFSFALVVGIIVGTYSSVFIASPIVLGWHNIIDQRRKLAAGPDTRPGARPVAGKAPAKLAGK